MGPKSGSKLFMVFKITKACTKLIGWSGGPDKRSSKRIEFVVELGRTHSEGAQIVAHHCLVTQMVCDVSSCPDPGRVGGTEELIRNVTGVHTEPEREIVSNYL